MHARFDPARARALLVGAGGLGSPAALTLARAGLGSIMVCDGDRVERSNLHRQVLHRAADLGRDKARSAAEALGRAAPGIEAIGLVERLTAANALGLVRGADVVLDGSDRFETKFLVNDACVLAGVPFVHAGAIRWQGQLLAVDPRPGPDGGGGDPCYRCLFEAPPPPAAGLSCVEAGVVGPVVGVVGALQAEAALALLAGRRGSGALLVYDGLSGGTRTVRFRRNPACLACGAARLAALDPAAYEVRAC